MGKKLVIVESPAKAKTINKYLGEDYIVKSSMGHIRDLPTSGSFIRKITDEKKVKIKNNKKKKKENKNEQTELINRMGIDPWNDWKANYQILPGKENIVCELKNLAAKAHHIYLATDLDREGEAIAWHLKEVIGGANERFSRVVFNEITKNAISLAFQKPVQLSIERVNAQQARRFMDRIVGYMISPLLWKKIARGLSAGRVQSVAMRLVVEREHKIKSFVTEEYWEVNANVLTPQGKNIIMQVMYEDNKIFRPLNYQKTQEAISILLNSTYEVFNVEQKTITNKPFAPFITSTLQQAANIRLGFSVKKTMTMAQRLYEAGHITYMRTDSFNLNKNAVMKIRSYIKKYFGQHYLPEVPNNYANKKNSQDAHEAIRPSDVNIIAEKLQNMENDAKKLYHLIWLQCVSCQMISAQYDCTTITVIANNFKLKAKGRTLLFDGWRKLLSLSLYKKDEEFILPKMAIGDKLILKKIIPTQHFTKPPSRFNEASLVRELEKRSIGRPSTYSSIISTIQERGYVRIENRRFYAEKMGEIVNNRLATNFRELMNYDFTAHMEYSLDQVAHNKIEWKTVLNSFFKDFSHQLNQAAKEPEEGGMHPNKIVLTSIECPSCNRKMGIRTASTGVFLGCSGYFLPAKERCKQTINLIPETENFDALEEDDAETNALRSRYRCKICNMAMDSYLTDSHSRLYVCGNNPECDGYEIEQTKLYISNHDNKILDCIKCNSKMSVKVGRFGKYMACINKYCKQTRKILKNGEIAPPKEDPIPLPELLCDKSDAYFILRDGESGIFLAANTFPKSRETRAPLVEELKYFMDRLPKKFKYLTEAPASDPEGNKTYVRFSRKTKQQYIASKKGGKITGWSMFYINSRWQETKQ